MCGRTLLGLLAVLSAVLLPGGNARAQGTVATDRAALDFAHFANGDGTTSDLVFVNLAPHPIRPAIYFYDTEGALLPAESLVDITGDSGDRRGRRADGPNPDGAAGSAHDFDSRPRGAGERIGAGNLGRSYRRDAAL